MSVLQETYNKIHFLERRKYRWRDIVNFHRSYRVQDSLVIDDNSTGRRTTSVICSSFESIYSSRKRSSAMNSIWFLLWRMKRVLIKKLIEDFMIKKIWISDNLQKMSIDILIILTRIEVHTLEWQLKIKWLQTITDLKLKFKSNLYREIISNWIDDIQLKDIEEKICLLSSEKSWKQIFKKQLTLHLKTSRDIIYVE